ncbi:hypothetical protein BDR05DRAFT_608777 [Suillus weaverae]|nr:hypothetical protein BDR05DRAFT_608777 [Suillus weaverae]
MSVHRCTGPVVLYPPLTNFTVLVLRGVRITRQYTSVKYCLMGSTLERLRSITLGLSPVWALAYRKARDSPSTHHILAGGTLVFQHDLDQLCA